MTATPFDPITLHEYIEGMYGQALEGCDENQFRRMSNDLHKCLTATMEAYRYHRLGDAKVQDGFVLTDATKAQQSYVDADYYYDMSREKAQESYHIQVEDSNKRGKQIATADISDLDKMLSQALANQGTLVYLGVDSEVVGIDPSDADNFEAHAIAFGLLKIAEMNEIDIDQLQPSLFTHDDGKWILMAERK